MESKSSHATNDIIGQIMDHVHGKSARRPYHNSPGWRWSTTLVVGQLFTVVLLRVGTGGGLPIMQMPVPEIHHKTIEVNGLLIQQVMFEDVIVCQASMAVST